MNLDKFDIIKLKKLIVYYESDDSSIVKSESNHSEFINTNDFSSEEQYIAIAAIKENALQDLSMQMTKVFLEDEGNKFLQESSCKDLFKKIYDKFEKSQKYQLLQLFFNFDLSTKRSVFFEKQRIRDYFYNIFIVMIADEDIDINNIKEEYISDDAIKYNKLFPIYDKIMSLTTKIS